MRATSSSFATSSWRLTSRSRTASSTFSTSVTWRRWRRPSDKGRSTSKLALPVRHGGDSRPQPAESRRGGNAVRGPGIRRPNDAARIGGRSRCCSTHLRYGGGHGRSGLLSQQTQPTGLRRKRPASRLCQWSTPGRSQPERIRRTELQAAARPKADSSRPRRLSS